MRPHRPKTLGWLENSKADGNCSCAKTHTGTLPGTQLCKHSYLAISQGSDIRKDGSMVPGERHEKGGSLVPGERHQERRFSALRGSTSGNPVQWAQGSDMWKGGSMVSGERHMERQFRGRRRATPEKEVHRNNHLCKESVCDGAGCWVGRCCTANGIQPSHNRAGGSSCCVVDVTLPSPQKQSLRAPYKILTNLQILTSFKTGFKASSLAFPHLSQCAS